MYQNRCCDQDDFSIDVFGGESDRKKVLCDKPFLLNNFGTQIYLPSLVETKNGYKAIASGFNIYLADHNVVSNSYYVKLYSSLTNS